MEPTTVLVHGSFAGSSSWDDVFGELDRDTPVGAPRIMAERAGSRRTVDTAGASHVVGMSHPAATAAAPVGA